MTRGAWPLQMAVAPRSCLSRLEELQFGAFVKDGDIVIRNEEGSIVETCGAQELKIPGLLNLKMHWRAAAIAYFGV